MLRNLSWESLNPRNLIKRATQPASGNFATRLRAIKYDLNLVPAFFCDDISYEVMDNPIMVDRAHVIDQKTLHDCHYENPYVKGTKIRVFTDQNKEEVLQEERKKALAEKKDELTKTETYYEQLTKIQPPPKLLDEHNQLLINAKKSLNDCKQSVSQLEDEVIRFDKQVALLKEMEEFTHCLEKIAKWKMELAELNEPTELDTCLNDLSKDELEQIYKSKEIEREKCVLNHQEELLVQLKQFTTFVESIYDERIRLEAEFVSVDSTLKKKHPNSLAIQELKKAQQDILQPQEKLIQELISSITELQIKYCSKQMASNDNVVSCNNNQSSACSMKRSASADFQFTSARNFGMFYYSRPLGSINTASTSPRLQHR